MVGPAGVPAGVDTELWDLLERFRAAMRDAGAPVADNLASGLEPEVVLERLAEVGMQASRQLVTWFAWQNGIADPDIPSLAASKMVKWVPYSLDEAFERYRMEDHGPEPWEWIPTWLPLAHHWGMPRLAADCTPPQGRVCMVRSVSPDTGLFSDTDAAPRPLDWAVRKWISMIEDYGYETTPKDVQMPTGWDGRWNDMPLEDRLTGIV